MIDLNEFAREVHALAVEKGFYDPEPADADLIAAIHSEISEAFEEWRAGRPMVHYDCGYSHENDLQSCIRIECPNWNDKDRLCYDCGNLPPEGIAVELIDVVLRTLDAAAHWGVEISGEAYDIPRSAIESASLPELATYLHMAISNAYWDGAVSPVYKDFVGLRWARSAIFAWLTAHDIDPVPLMLEKHAYNRSRPYRHGGKRI